VSSASTASSALALAASPACSITSSSFDTAHVQFASLTNGRQPLFRRSAIPPIPCAAGQRGEFWLWQDQ
jgi:hypothetical protein